METKNKGVVLGTIVSLKGDENTGKMVVACPVINRAYRNSKLESSVHDNYPSLSFNSLTQTKDIVKDYKIGDRVEISFYLQVYLRVDTQGETQYLMNAYITEVHHVKSQLEEEFGLAGRVFPDAKNEIYLAGKLLGIIKKKNSIELRLEAPINGRKNVLSVVGFNIPSSITNELSIGDELCVLACMQTVDMKTKERVKEYQNIVALDIAKKISKNRSEPCMINEKTSSQLMKN